MDVASKVAAVLDAIVAPCFGWSAFLTNRSRSTAAYGQPVVRSRGTAG
jgi:hypothetical protein